MLNGIDEIKGDVIKTVAKLCAAAAVTAPKSGGQLFSKGKHLFVETVIVDDKETIGRLAEWIRARGRERRQEIWFRDAATAEKLDGILFIGLLENWYPPIYDCGACGYATCAEFMEAAKPLEKRAGTLSSPGRNAICGTSTWVSPWAPPPRPRAFTMSIPAARRG